MKLNNIEEVDLIKLPISATEALDAYTIVKHHLELETFYDAMIEALVYHIKTYILAEEVDNRSKVIRFTYNFPSNWWQHFRAQVFPRWLLKRFPIKLTEYTKVKRVTFRKYATYPKANIVFPDKVGTLVKYKSFIEET